MLVNNSTKYQQNKQSPLPMNATERTEQKKNKKNTMPYDVENPGPDLEERNKKFCFLYISCKFMTLVLFLVSYYLAVC